MVQHGCLWKSCQAGGPPREAEKAEAFQEAWNVDRLSDEDSFDVECVADGVAALTRILARMPNLIVLDLSMPNMNGVELLETIRSYFRLQSLPVIVWTALSDGPLAGHAQKLKINSIIEKGKSSYKDLLAAIQKALPGQTGSAEDEEERDNQPI
jgi:CheY-like chemotaxis protein